MTFSNEDGRKQVWARVSDDLYERVESFADDHDMPKADVVRKALREYLPENEDEIGPAEPKLRETYLWLRERTDHENRIPSTVALSKLAQNHQVDKEFVKSSRLQPLDQKGWIVPQQSYIRVLEHHERNPFETQPNE